MRRLFRTWKTRLHADYSLYAADDDRISHRPGDVTPEDWVFLVELFGSEEYQRDPISGGKAKPDEVWEHQHTRKNENGELVWSDPKSQLIHGQLQEIVHQQQSEENENPMNADAILATVLGERSGYVRGKGYGKRPPKRSRVQQVDLEATMSSTMENMRQAMQVELDKRLQEKREQAQVELDNRLQEEHEQAELRRNLEEKKAAELQRKLENDRVELQRQLELERAEFHRKIEEEKESMNRQLDKRIQEQMAIFMKTLQRGQTTKKR